MLEVAGRDVFGTRQEVRHQLQLGHVHRLDGVLQQLGVAAVIAPSYNGLYFRNAFNVGLLLLTCPQAELLQEGERLVLEPQGSGVVSTLSGRLACEPVPDFLMAMVRAGGLFNQLKQRLAAPARVPANPPATPSPR